MYIKFWSLKVFASIVSRVRMGCGCQRVHTPYTLVVNKSQVDIFPSCYVFLNFQTTKSSIYRTVRNSILSIQLHLYYKLAVFNCASGKHDLIINHFGWFITFTNNAGVTWLQPLIQHIVRPISFLDIMKSVITILIQTRLCLDVVTTARVTRVQNPNRNNGGIPRRSPIVVPARFGLSSLSLSLSLSLWW